MGISRGFNFRFARYYQNAGVETRTLFKAYGILFKVVTTGRVCALCVSIVFYVLVIATRMCVFHDIPDVCLISCSYILHVCIQGGKFDFTTLVLKIGSMIALLGIVSYRNSTSVPRPSPL